jgi:hypothetical protein
MADSVGPQHGRAEGARPAWLIPAAIGVAVLIVAGIVVGVLLSRHDEVAAAAPTAPAPIVTTVLLPVPTPDIAPSARASTTPFTAALPASVLQYAFAASQQAPDWLAAGALEAWSDSYTDGGAGKLTVQAGQWPTVDEAKAFAATLTAALPSAVPSPAATGGPALPRSGSVVVSGTAAGSFSIADGGDGTGVAVWTNGSAVFRMVAPLADIVNAYGAFPL